MSELPSPCKMRHCFNMTEAAPAPLTRRLDLARLGDDPETVTIETSAAERAAIAAAFGIPAIAALSGSFHLRRAGGPRIEARLELAAEVTQSCIVSLEPVDQSIAETAALLLVTNGAPVEDDDMLDPDAPDQVALEGTVADLGALLVEQLALALDPYPRRPGAEPPAAPDAGAAPQAHPFAALAKLRRPE
ncbi:MAG: hypothetical protein B7Z76_14810 [Acidiphilium sp. 20-67-58]|jgi:uncharacterized metal-binding protein YceD (DUF177 family)|nr:MAG: hypothetical protein B7Z76_14810 [Acidiphilium sp. 20-67-58]